MLEYLKRVQARCLGLGNDVSMKKKGQKVGKAEGGQMQSCVMIQVGQLRSQPGSQEGPATRSRVQSMVKEPSPQGLLGRRRMQMR